MTVRLLIACGDIGTHMVTNPHLTGAYAILWIHVNRALSIENRRLLRTYNVEYLALDAGVSTTWSLLEETRRFIQGTSSSGQEGARSYIDTSLQDPRDIKRVHFLSEHVDVDVPLAEDLVHSPAIAGLAVRHPGNKEALDIALGKLLWSARIGYDNPLEVWIVSSMVEGIGAGIHRFVGALVGNWALRRFVDMPVLLNFVSVFPTREYVRQPRRAGLNTFFGIAADAAFALQISEMYPSVVTQWFYIDTGSAEHGDISEPVALVVRLLMLKELQKDLHWLTAYNLVLDHADFFGNHSSILG